MRIIGACQIRRLLHLQQYEIEQQIVDAQSEQTVGADGDLIDQQDEFLVRVEELNGLFVQDELLDVTVQFDDSGDECAHAFRVADAVVGASDSPCFQQVLPHFLSGNRDFGAGDRPAQVHVHQERVPDWVRKGNADFLAGFNVAVGVQDRHPAVGAEEGGGVGVAVVIESRNSQRNGPQRSAGHIADCVVLELVHQTGVLRLEVPDGRMLCRIDESALDHDSIAGRDSPFGRDSALVGNLPIDVLFAAFVLAPVFVSLASALGWPIGRLTLARAVRSLLAHCASAGRSAGFQAECAMADDGR